MTFDFGITTPGAVPFAPGVSRAPFADRYTSTDTADAATRSLSSADAALTRTATSSQADAYRGRIADRGRIHRPDVMPIIGEAAGLAWLRTQPAYASGATRYSEVAASRDLGYTWGTYTLPQSGAGPAAKGFYTRVWVRSRDGSWKVAPDVFQPQQ